jgi:Cu/Ag efflux protein CusF
MHRAALQLPVDARRACGSPPRDPQAAGGAKRVLSGWAGLVVFLASLVAGGPCAAVESFASNGAQILIYATVIEVDRHRHLVTLHHEALDTVPASTRVCRLRRPSDDRRLIPGATIEAVADTSHNPWVLDQVIVRDPPRSPLIPSAARRVAV